MNVTIPESAVYVCGDTCSWSNGVIFYQSVARKRLLVCGKKRFMPLNIVICGVCLALGCLGPLVPELCTGVEFGHFRGLSCPLDVTVGRAVHPVGVCLSSPMVCCSVDWAVCLCGGWL